MSKITATRFWRKNEPLGRHILKRSEPIASKDRHPELCQYCKQVVEVADGQIAYFHKECRKKKRSYQNQGKPRNHV